MSKLEVLPLAGRIGAEVRGVRLDPDLDSSTAAAIHDAWLQHKVVFFRHQDHLDDETQEHLAGFFGGTAMAHPTVPSANGTDFIYEVDSTRGAANAWHTDLSWFDALPRGSILRAVVVPPYGGDTMWANTAAAYRDLPPRLRAFADSSWVLHSNGSEYVSNRADQAGQTSDERAFWSAFQSKVFLTSHPLVHVHPETREPCLLAGQFVRRVVGTTAAQTARLHAVVQRYITRPENTVRWRWAVGDVAVWDNRATQHYAIADYGDATRVMRRISMDGEPTVSLDGRRCRSVTRESPARRQPLGPPAARRASVMYRRSRAAASR